MSKPTPIDEYLKAYPEPVHAYLQTLRQLIHKEVDGLEESISYGIPTFKRDGKYVVYIAGFKNHVSLYPVSDEIVKALPEITEYRTGKGTLQFSLAKPLPLPMIRKLVRLLDKAQQARIKKY